IGLVAELSARQSGGYARSIAPLGRAHRARYAPRIWRIRPAFRRAFYLSRRRHGVLRWLPRDRRAPQAGGRAASHRGLSSRFVSQSAYQPGRRHTGVPGSGRALDGSDALRDVSPLLRAGRRACGASEGQRETARHRAEDLRNGRGRDEVLWVAVSSWQLAVGSWQLAVGSWHLALST